MVRDWVDLKSMMNVCVWNHTQTGFFLQMSVLCKLIHLFRNFPLYFILVRLTYCEILCYHDLLG